MKKIRLKAKHDRRFRTGHPWAYSNELQDSPKGIEPGEALERRSTGIAEFDRVTGGGLVPGSALLVGGGRDGFEMVQALAKQLDTAGPALSGRIRLVAVQFADARVLAATLTTLFDQRYSAARTTDVQRNKPLILPDPRSNSLLITASQDDNRAIDELLQRLDTRLDNPALQLTVLPLKHNDAGRVAQMIESIFAARRAAICPDSGA